MKTVNSKQYLVNSEKTVVMARLDRAIQFPFLCHPRLSGIFLVPPLFLHTQADSPRREEQIEKHVLRQPVQEGGFR
jgi:hypothetical protein